MKNRFLLAALGLSLSTFFATASDVVINEIMYHPFHLASQAEDTGQEWVELHNRETNAVNLHGWRLTKGVEFTFTNVTLPPGGYIVVAASRTNFLAKYPGITNVVHTNANSLRSQYQAALINNPNLKFGQFVAATRLAQNLGGRHPNITRDAILAGLASGRSIGQTLQDLGLNSHDAKAARKQTEKEIEQARR